MDEWKFKSNIKKSQVQAGSFEDLKDEDISDELKQMMGLGIMNPNSTEYSDEKVGGMKFNRMHSNNENFQYGFAEECEDEDLSDELKKMANLGIMNPNLTEHSDEKVGEMKFNRMHSNNENFQYGFAEEFEDEDLSDELKKMANLGIMNPNLTEHSDEKVGEMKFNRMHSNNENFQYGFAEKVENEDTNDELKKMMHIGIMNPNFTENTKVHQSYANKPITHPKNRNKKQTKNYKLIPLKENDKIFEDIVSDFTHCKVKRKIKAIQLVENNKLKTLFENEKKQLISLNGRGFDVNVAHLYHASNAARNLICSRGLDIRLSKQGFFGKGIYFSDHLQKCMKYLNGTKGCAIYKCAVVLGDVKKFPDRQFDETLKQEPEKKDGDYYHSVQGKVDQFNEYIIYDNRRCLIEYRIVFEGIEDEDDEEMEDVVVREEEQEKENERWIRDMHKLVDSCVHDEKLDEETEKEIRNIEKIRLEIRRRRELQAGGPITKVTHELLRIERKKWSKFQSKIPNSVVPEERTHIISPQRQSKSDDPEGAEFTPEHAVLFQMVTEFAQITNCKDSDLAEKLIITCNWDLNAAVDAYFARKIRP